MLKCTMPGDDTNLVLDKKLDTLDGSGGGLRDGGGNTTHWDICQYSSGLKMFVGPSSARGDDVVLGVRWGGGIGRREHTQEVGHEGL
jgi:hypothetical protein